MKTNLLTSRNLNHNSPREGLEAFKKAHRSIVMAEFTNMEGTNMWKGYILQKIKDTYYFIPVSERCLYDEYTTQTGKWRTVPHGSASPVPRLSGSQHS